MRNIRMLGIAWLWLFCGLSAMAADDSFGKIGIKVHQSSLSALSFEIQPIVLGFDTVIVAGTQTILPRIAGAEPFVANVGEPYSLRLTIPITVPAFDGFHLGKVQVLSVRSIAGIMSPKPMLKLKEEMPTSEYMMNDEAYSHSQTPEWAEISYRGIARSRHLAMLTLTLARFDTEKKVIHIPASMRITILFDAQKATNSAQNTDTFDPAVSLNHQETKAWRLAEATTSALQKTANSVQSASAWAKIGVDAEGIYKIDAGQLSSLGITVKPTDIASIKIFGIGGEELPESVNAGINNTMIEQPLIIRTKQTGELESVVFYASPANGFRYSNGNFIHSINHFSNRSYYILSIGGSNGLRAVPAAEPQGDAQFRPTTHTSRLFFEEEKTSPYSPGSGKRWFGRSVDKNFSATFTTPLPGLIRSGLVMYRACVAHKNSTKGDFLLAESNASSTAFLDIDLNGISTGGYQSAYSATQSATIPASSLSDNRSVLQFTYRNDAGSSGISGLIDWFEIHYPREFVASANQLEFFTDKENVGISEFTVNGFSGAPLGFDVSDRKKPQLLENKAMTGGLFMFKTETKENSPKRFFLSSELKSPASLEKVEVGTLREQFANTDMIVITHSDFLTSANAYKKFRESRGELTVSVVTTEQIFNEFSSGMPDPVAIRDFLAFAYKNWDKKPAYVLLWGDGHYDYKNIRSTDKNYVPTRQILDPDGSFDAVNGTYLSEDFFACIVGEDDIMDIALGRMPVHSPQEADWVVEKIRRYETESSEDAWRTVASFVADDGPTGHGSDYSLHTNQSEDLSTNFVPQSFRQKKIYIVDYPTESIPGGYRKPRAMQEIVNVVNSGTVILNWVGHGNPRLWAHEVVFEKDQTIPLFTNKDKYFFLTAATCDFGRFDDVERQSGAEELVSSKVGGAIGVFSATRAVYADQNARITQKFYTELFKMKDGKYARLGDAMLGVKQGGFTDLNDKKFYLLGDPAMRLLFPDREIRITKLNGEEIPANKPIEIHALSTVEVSGIIAETGNPSKDSEFNGTVFVSLFDSDIEKRVKDIDEEQTIHRFSVFGGLLNICGAQVKNGEFTARFVVPKDISFTDQKGRIVSYAFAQNGAHAKGSSRDFTVGGLESEVLNDGKGPDISIYFDSRSFHSGDYVKPIPLLIVELADATGINATGLGIGHNIEAWLNSSPTSMNLTEYFAVSPLDYRKGSVEKEIFDLLPGKHRIRVRAWDVFNNFSETETYFRIAGSGESFIADDPVNYPNPFTQSTTLQFRHNSLSPVDVQCSIFTPDGAFVRSMTQTVSSRTAEILWDGKDSEGNLLAAGIYLYKLVISSGNAQQEQLTGKMMMIR